jgi:hypothetical protein
MVNRLTEFWVPRFFNTNQKLINFAITMSVIPVINRILSSFAIFKPTSKQGYVTSKTYLIERQDIDEHSLMELCETRDFFDIILGQPLNETT